MTIDDLKLACEQSPTGSIRLVSPNEKRPIPRLKAELLCVNPHDGHSVWLYDTKRVLAYLRLEAGHGN